MKTYTVTESATLINRHGEVIRRAIREKRLKARKVRGLWLIGHDALMEWSQKGRGRVPKVKK